MRLARLGLDRYGHFTGRQLDFPPEARVTVVLGGNEAGKTTALCAVADALYGIEERSRFNFLHEYKQMRLSATLAGADGRTLSFARLKRRSATLVDPDTEAPLADDSLAPFLGGHDRRAFLDIFGLDQTRLRDGGRKLLEGGGDLAETLFAAAPGLGRVAALRDRLKASAGLVFNPDRRNATHAFYVGIDKRQRALRAIQEHELRADTVRAAREGAAAAAQARAEAVGAEIEAGLAAARAQALRQAARELRAVAAEEEALARLGPLPAFPADGIAEARRLLAARAAARTEADRAAAELAAALAARQAIVTDAAILAVADAVERCDEDRVAIERERASLPNRRREAEAARGGLARIAAGLGLPTVETLLERMPGPPELARADKLLDRRRAHDTRRAALAEEQAGLARRRARIAAMLARLDEVEDPAPLERSLGALDGAEERERALHLLDQRILAARCDLDARIARLPFPAPGMDALAAAALPDPAVAEGALREVEAATEAAARLKDAQIALDEQAALTGARRARLDDGGRAPTDAAVAEARAGRDRLWRRLRPAIAGTRPAVPGDAADAAALDAAIGAADHLADARQKDAGRLAEIARCDLDLAELAARRDAAAARGAEAARAVRAAEAAFAALWPASLTLAPEPRTLSALREALALRQAHDALRRDAMEAETQRAACARDRAEADRIRHALGLPPLAAAPLRMAELRAAVADRIGRFRAAGDSRRDLAQLERAEADLAQRAADLGPEAGVLGAEAQEILPALAVRPEATVDEARAALDLWREALALVADLATAERRIAAIEQDEATFVARAEALLRRLDAAPAADGPFAAVRALRGRLEAAGRSRAGAEAADTALAARRAALAAAGAGLQRIDADLAGPVAAAGFATPEQLAGRLDALDTAAAVRARLEAARARLSDLGDATALAAAVAGRDDEALAREAAAAAAAHDAARAARDRAVERDAEARAALDALDRHQGAAAAAQEEQDAAAQIAGAVEAFTRDHVAARLLTRAIERYRARHQNPMVERASAAFRLLTGGRWSGIAVDYDAATPRLAAARDGALGGIADLSEGTADQLFLALRVAAIEAHARRATPLPFIADDLFVSFDEARTETGLQLLAELGAHTQVIVFTHHAHVAGIAARALGDAGAVLAL